MEITQRNIPHKFRNKYLRGSSSFLSSSSFISPSEGGSGSADHASTADFAQSAYTASYAELAGHAQSADTAAYAELAGKANSLSRILDILGNQWSGTTDISNISASTASIGILDVEDNLNVSGSTALKGFVRMLDDLSVRGALWADSSAYISNNISAGGNLRVSGDSTTIGDNIVYGNSILSGGTTTTGIQSENVTNTGTIKTKDLEVTGSAHFFELIIDKIKAAGGAILLTPADGFRVDYVEDVTNGKKLYFRSTDNSGKGIMNMWKVGDQAICQSFNQATVGTQYDVSNKYWWSLVTEVSEQPTQKTVSGETNDYHYITISTQHGVDGQNRPYYDGTVNVEVGDEIAMLGYRGTDEPQRQSAIYLAAYRSVDLGLTAPHFAEYQGIDDFNLAAHRRSYIDANGAKFVGGLYVDASTSVQDYVSSATTEVHNELKFDIDGLTSRVEHQSRPNILPNNDWHDQDSQPVYQENDEQYEVSGQTECIAFPPVMYLNAGTYTPSIYGYGKFKTIRYGESKNNLDNELPVDTMVDSGDTWNSLPRSQAIFIAPINGYYSIGIELMDSSYSGDTPYIDYIESGETSGSVETQIQVDASPYIKVNREEASQVEVYPPDYDGNIVYKSSNPQAVSVDGEGNIIGVGQGNATIYVSIPESYTRGKHYLSSQASVSVHCEASAATTTTIVNFPSTVISGRTYTVDCEVTPSDYPGQVTFTSSNESIASISGNTLTVKGLGNFTVTATAQQASDNGYVYVESTDSKNVNAIEHYTEQTTVQIILASTLYKGEKVSPTVSVWPEMASYQLYSTSPSIAYVTENGEISASTSGTCSIIASVPEFLSGETLFLSSSASTQVTVENNIESQLHILINNSSNPQTISGNTQGEKIRPSDSVEIQWSTDIENYPLSAVTATSSYSGITTNTQQPMQLEMPSIFEKESFHVEGDISTWYRVKNPVITITGSTVDMASGNTRVVVNGDSNQATIALSPYTLYYTFTPNASCYVNGNWGDSQQPCIFFDIQNISNSGFTQWLGTPTAIPSISFNGGDKLKTLDMSDLESVLSASSRSFINCTSLESIVLPPNLQSIGYRAFEGCTSLTHVTLPDSVTYAQGRTFYNCESLRSINLSNSLASISDEMFMYTSLSAITIPQSVAQIGNYAFVGCAYLDSVKIESSTPPYCWEDSFINTSERIMNLLVPRGSFSDYYNNEYYRNSFVNITEYD